MERYETRGKALEFFPRYLNKRNLYYCRCTNTSHIPTIEYDIPQGPVVRPLLFIIYANDILNTVRVTKNRLFADDTTI